MIFPFRRKQNRPSRYPPDKNTIAVVHFGPSADLPRDALAGLVVNVSKNGCKIVVINGKPPGAGTLAFVSLGEAQFGPAVLRWANLMEENICLMGFDFQELP